MLIFSPTLTVGVSNLNNVNYHFHYDSSLSTDVISSIQMLKRTRKTKEIHMFVKEKINYIKTSYNDIRDEYMTNIGKNIEQNYLFDIDDYGNARLSEIGKKAIKIDTFKNILEFNHKEAFLWLLKYHFQNEPRNIDTEFSHNVLMKYQKQIKENKEIILANNIQQYMSLNSMEKNDLLLNNDADKVLKALAEIDDNIKECPEAVKSKILEITLKDKSFLQKCIYYKVVFYYTKNIWDISDVKHLISKAIIKNKLNDLHFYNTLIEYGQKEIFDEYTPREINKNKRLKYLLDKCGYRITKQDNPGLVGHRGYLVDINVKEFYGWIK